ncbi:MAG: hypothetical protein ACRD1Y_04090 [Terriglobales bacterium]
MATPTLVQARVTYAAFEYGRTWDGIVLDRARLAASAEALYRALRQWGIAPSGVKANQPANAAGPLVTFEIGAGKYKVVLSASGLSVFVQWVDWAQAPHVEGMVQACLDAISGVAASVSAQSAAIAVQAIPDSLAGGDITIALAPPAALAAGGVTCFGMALYTDDGRHFLVDRSSVNPGGLYFRIGHEFGSDVGIKQILEALRTDQAWLTGLYHLEF